MDRNIERNQWAIFLKEFNKKNQSRPTRLEVFDQMGVQTEEHELPLMGVDLEMRGEGAPRIEIMLGGQGADERHLTHTITCAQRVNVKISEMGGDEVLEIEGEGNVKTVLQFESVPELGATS